MSICVDMFSKLGFPAEYDTHITLIHAHKYAKIITSTKIAFNAS